MSIGAKARYLAFATLIVWVSVFPSTAIAQLATAVTPPLVDPSASETVIKKRVDEVNLLFTVVDGKGRFVKKLQLEDFQLLDDQRPPERIRAFHQESDLPMRVGLLIDISGSITQRFKFEQQSAIKFLKKIVRPGRDKVFVVGFTNVPSLEQDLTDDTTALAAAVHRLKPGGNTALYDAVVFAANKLKQSVEPDTRRVIILISDGDSNAGYRYMHEAEEAALKAEAPIFALSTNSTKKSNYTRGDAVLELLSKHTGGELLPANESTEVVHAFRQVEDALRSQYVVSYKPADFQLDGRYRQIALAVRNQKLTVECRRGYFAPHE